MRSVVKVTAMHPSQMFVRYAATAAAAGSHRKNRPISPHVQIFKFPLPAMVSITTRFTGAGLSAGIALTGIGCLLGDPVRDAFAFLLVWADLVN